MHPTVTTAAPPALVAAPATAIAPPRAVVGWQYLATVVAALVLARHYGDDMPGALARTAWLLAAVATCAVLAAAPLAIGVGLVAAWPRPRVARWASPWAFALLLAFLYADTLVWRLYQRHIDGFVLSLVGSRAGRDSFTIGLGTWLSGGAVVIGLAAVPVIAGLLAPRLPWPRGRAWWRGVAIALGVVVVADKALFTWGDLGDRSACTRVRVELPLYAGITMRRIAGRLGVHVAPAVHAPDPGRGLAWPKAPLVWAAGAAKPNVLIIAIEGCRFDMLDEAVMPNLAAYARGAIVADRNLSGGNATRCGLFSLLYGLWGTEWARVLGERRSPLLVDELVARGYTPRVLSCTSLESPEFRATAFSRVTGAITDEWPGAERVDRDRVMTDTLIGFLGEGRAPFFAFAFYDASHQPYLFPPEFARFAPTCRAEDLDFVKLADDPAPLAGPLRNRYKNALGYVDAQIRRVLDALAQRHLEDDTIVLVCGDHGEEFAESGRRVGHNNAYTRWQTQTAFVLRIPGEAPRHLAWLTSHVDVVPTLFARLGVRNPASDYSHGRDMLAGGEPYAVIAGWSDAAVVDERGIAVFGTDTTALGFTRYDPDYRRGGDEVGPPQAELLDVLKRMGEFTRGR